MAIYPGTLASFPGSPPLRAQLLRDLLNSHSHGKTGGEPGTFYHVSDVKGRENLIARGQNFCLRFSSPAFNYYAQCARRGGGRRPGNEATASLAAVLLRRGLALRTDGCVEKIIKRESRVVVANGRAGGDREVPKQPAR